MAKRDYISEIQSIRDRAEFNSRYDFQAKLGEIEEALNEFISYNGSYNSELLKHIPIATIACFEAFFRSTIKELVDFGKPFSDNVTKYNQANNAKISFDIIAAIQSKSLTVGEFVAHFLSFSSYEDIDSNVGILIGGDFTKQIKSFARNSVFEHVNKEIAEFQKMFPQILLSVKRTFELRHIFCHEFATNISVDREEIIQNFKNCRLFLQHVDNFIWHILYPDSPETQAEMNQFASDRFASDDRLLENTVFAIKAVMLEDSGVDLFEEDMFNLCMNKWKEYRKLHAEFAAEVVKGGSMYSLLYASDMSRVTQEKIESLRQEFSVALRKSKYKPE